MNTAAKSALVFAAGNLGGLVNSVALWLFGLLGINAALGVALAPALTASWLYPRLVWGGIWGFLFLLPLFKGQWFTKGFLLSLGPTLVQLFLVFPYQAHKGMMGLELGTLMPLLVVFYNAIWGWTAALWLKWAQADL
mgnify:CR=1 FL=1